MQQYQVKEVFNEDFMFDYVVVNSAENIKEEVLLRFNKGDFLTNGDTLYVRLGTGFDVMSNINVE